MHQASICQERFIAATDIFFEFLSTSGAKSPGLGTYITSNDNADGNKLTRKYLNLHAYPKNVR